MIFNCRSIKVWFSTIFLLVTNPSFLCVLAQESASQAADPYAEEPYWYKPGHPSNPAEAANIETLPGFVAERIFSVPPEMGSWTTISYENNGRLIAASQHKPGLFRILPSDTSAPESKTQVQPLSGVAAQIGFSQGLLYAFDSLYVVVSEKNENFATGLYRLEDRNGDDQYDTITKLFELDGTGEHGPHNLVVSPDKSSLYLICGNGTKTPERSSPDLPESTEGFDRLLPPGFESSQFSTAGYVLRFDPDGSNRQIIASGLRNSYDLAFDNRGELFTYDSDMEWDLGTPWYRPTRICHITSGSEFGWRESGANWPDNYEDSVGSVLDIGPGSPTGMTFGYGTNFPEKYRNALFVCDWTFATIHAIHLAPTGASYEATFEQFLGGSGLPVTDITASGDGNLYFVVGGRRLGSAVYRVRYTGPIDDLGEVKPPEISNAIKIRRKLEAYHSKPASDQLSTIWAYLGDGDRSIRFAARIALEKLPIAIWKEMAFQETDTKTKLTAYLALARKLPNTELPAFRAALLELELEKFDESDMLHYLRICELALGREYGEDGATATQLQEKLARYSPQASDSLINDINRIRCYLGDESVIEQALDSMENDNGQLSSRGLDYYARNPKYGKAIRDMLEAAPLMSRMDTAKMLLWIQEGWTDEQRLRYFGLIEDAKRNSKGGHWYYDYWNQIRDVAMAQLDADTKSFVTSRIDAFESDDGNSELPSPIGPGKEWTLQNALHAFDSNNSRRDLENGRRTFAAASCISCHRLGDQGGSVGPDLSSLGQRFTPSDILEAIIDPSKAISDQYQLTVFTTTDGKTYSGKVLSRGDDRVILAPNLLKPQKSLTIEANKIQSEQKLPVSTMPSGLLNSLNETELLDLLAYLVSAGDPNSVIYKPAESVESSRAN